MTALAAPLAEIRRGAFLESVHAGHAVICDASGAIVEAWGDPQAVVLPRSSAKMIQALPLLMSGAGTGLSDAELALACASHQGAPMHVEAVARWLTELGLSEPDLRCGPQPSRDAALHKSMLCADEPPSQLHNNCSGKHAGFLMLGRHLGAGPDYIDPAHPVQKAVREVFEDVTGAPSPGFAIDGCSAPNFATTMQGMARAMARFAAADGQGGALDRAAARLTQAMYAHPEYVAGEGRACTLLMRAATEPVALKTGAEGFFVAILPKRGLGIAVKAADGATRAAECAIAALLVRLGVADAGHADVVRFLSPEIRNWRGIVTGGIRPAPGLAG